MLTISRKQIAELEKDQIRRFKSEIFTRFREAYPRQSSHHDDEKLRAIIDAATDAGRKRGIRTKGRLSQFVGIAVMLDEDFYKRQEITDFLDYSGFTADDKVAILADKLSDQLRNVE